VTIHKLLRNLGGARAVAGELRISYEGIRHWWVNNKIPTKHYAKLFAMALAKGIDWQPNGIMARAPIVVVKRNAINRAKTTEAELARIRDLRTGGMSFHRISGVLGNRSRDWCERVARDHGFYFAAPARIARVPSARELAGSDPLPAGHPIALQALEEARLMRIEE